VEKWGGWFQNNFKALRLVPLGGALRRKILHTTKLGAMGRKNRRDEQAFGKKIQKKGPPTPPKGHPPKCYRGKKKKKSPMAPGGCVQEMDGVVQLALD